MANKTISELTDATLPLLGTDKTIVSRDGVNLNDVVLSELPVSTATQTALDTKVSTSALTESVQDIIGSSVVAGANVTVAYNDTDGTTTISSTAGGTTPTNVPFLGSAIGDSITAQCGIRNNAQSASNNSNGFSTWAQVLSKKTIDIPPENIFGVGGNTLAQMAARITSVTNLNPLPSFCLIGGGANLGPNFAGMKSSCVTMINALLAVNITPVFLAAMPSDGASASTQQTRQAYNNFLSQVANGNATIRTSYGIANGKVLFADFTDQFIDYTLTNGNAIAGMLSDGLHWSGIGSYVAGQRIYEVLRDAGMTCPEDGQNVTVGSAYHVTDAPNGNLMNSQASLMMGTAGTITTRAGLTVTGTMPTGLNIRTWVGDGTTNLTLTRANKVGAASGTALRIQIAKTDAGTAPYELYHIKPITSSAVLPADKIVCEIEYTINSAPVNVAAVSLTVDQATDNKQYITTGVYPTFLHSGKLKTPVYTVPATGVTTLNPTFELWLAAVSGATLDITIDRFVMYKIV